MSDGFGRLLPMDDYEVGPTAAIERTYNGETYEQIASKAIAEALAYFGLPEDAHDQVSVEPFTAHAHGRTFPGGVVSWEAEVRVSWVPRLRLRTPDPDPPGDPR